jgi:hypothetical protein
MQEIEKYLAKDICEHIIFDFVTPSLQDEKRKFNEVVNHINQLSEAYMPDFERYKGDYDYLGEQYLSDYETGGYFHRIYLFNVMYRRKHDFDDILEKYEPYHQYENEFEEKILRINCTHIIFDVDWFEKMLKYAYY